MGVVDEQLVVGGTGPGEGDGEESDGLEDADRAGSEDGEDGLCLCGVRMGLTRRKEGKDSR